jgi:protein TonB
MQSQRRLMIASAVLNVAALAILLHVRRIHVEPTRLPGTANGTRISLTYSPGGAPAQSAMAAVKPVAAKLTQAVKSIRDTHTHVAAATTTLPPSPNPSAAQGGDARGSGNVTVALAQFFPNPKPDLTVLPHGTRGDVIVDVTIDEQGKIVESQVAQSMGSTIDQTVLATIQTWTFKPATKDGVPVPSQQELLFHYERG